MRARRRSLAANQPNARPRDHWGHVALAQGLIPPDASDRPIFGPIGDEVDLRPIDWNALSREGRPVVLAVHAQ